MQSGIGEIVWMMTVIGGPIVLGLVIAYAIWQWRHRRRELDTRREAVTRSNYLTENRKSEEDEARAKRRA